MDDLISRQAAIDAIGEEPLVWYDGEDEIAERNQWERDIEAIKQLPPAEPTFDARDTQYNLPIGTDCISRRQAIDALDKCHCGGKDENGRPWIYKENAVEAIEMVEPLPPAEPKRGKWIYHIDDLFPAESTMECNQCHAEQPLTCDDEFCPHCGAKMEVTE